MSFLVPIAIFGWIPVVLVLFTQMRARRAVIVSFLGAWLFLPIAGYNLPGLPPVDKMFVTCVGALLGTAFFDSARLGALRLSLWDLPMVAWVLCPIPAAVANNYGVYEGFSLGFAQGVSWALPYIVGRLYFADPQGQRELAMGIFVGGLIYLPLVLFESRMSPQLHTWVYGYYQHEFGQARRGEGWRPTVFMQHGLSVAMFMGTAALCGVWLWAAGKFRAMAGFPAWMLSGALFVTAAACRSTYALLLMLAGTAALFLGRALGTRLILVCMLAVPPSYVALRTIGGWDAGILRDTAASMGPDRAESLNVRLDSEDVCWSWVQRKLMFGACRLDEVMLNRETLGRFVPDALWLIALAKFGAVGLLAMFAMFLTPPALYLARFRAKEISGPELAGATVMAVALILYTLDALLNAMINPIYLLSAGGLVGMGRAAAALKIAPHRARTR